MIDLIIRNVTAVTMNASRDVLPTCSLLVDQGVIQDIKSFGPREALPQAKQVVDGEGMIALPGLINTHFHLPQVMMRGIYDSIEALDKLKNYTWPIQGNYTQEDALTSAQLGVLEMIKSGTTAFISTGLHPRYGIDNIAQMLLDSGIRAVISKYVMDTNAYDLDKSALHKGMWETGEESMQQAISLIEKWHGQEDGRLKVWISPRSVGGCSVDLLKRVVKVAREYDVGITAHWSEVPSNVEYTLKNFGQRPIVFAESFGLLGPKVVLAHGIYLNDDEINKLAETGTSIAHCPVTNSKLAMGIAKVPQMLRAGVNVTLANDGMGVNNTADLFREMRSMLLLHRVTQDNPLYPSTAQALEMATLHGAKALGEIDRLGSLEVGKKADIILVKGKQAHTVPLHDPASALVWAAAGCDVDTSIIDGKVVMQNREVYTMDEDKIIAQAEEKKEKILAQAGVKAQKTW